MKTIIKTSTILFILMLLINHVHAQVKPTYSHAKKSVEDSLWGQFQNAVYYTYYNPAYMSNTTTTSTVMKIDIDWQSKVTSIRFSDSADLLFASAFTNRPKWNDDKITLEKYARIMKLTSISLLIPINYEPNYPKQQKVFSYDELEGWMKFDKKSFTGKAIIFEPINISVLSKGNM